MNIFMCVIKDMNKFIVFLKIMEIYLILAENLSVWSGQCYVITRPQGRGNTERSFCMKNFFKIFGIIVFVAVIGLTMGCNTDDGGGNNNNPVNNPPVGDTNPFIGTWTMTDGGVLYMLTFTETSVTMRFTDLDGETFTVPGSYTRSGNTATMTMSMDGDTMIETVTILANSFVMGDWGVFRK